MQKNSRMKDVLKLVFASFALILGIESAWSAVVQDLEIQAAGHTWTYHLHIPSTISKVPAPLVLVFHGAGGDGKSYLNKNGWAALSEQEGFIVAAPDGLPALPRMPANFRLNPRLWNSGQLNPRSPRAGVDDLAFINALVNDISDRTTIDRGRVFATGHSNGAGMTFKIGAELSTRFAGIATVMGLNTSEGALPTRALPTLMIIGMRDPLNPMEGGERQLPWGKSTVPPVSQGIQAWSNSLGCTWPAVRDRDDDQIILERFQGCRDGAMYTIWYLKGQGHSWPGGKDSGLPESVMGPNVTKVNATSLIWQFFSSLNTPA